MSRCGFIEQPDWHVSHAAWAGYWDTVTLDYDKLLEETFLANAERWNSALQSGCLKINQEIIGKYLRAVLPEGKSHYFHVSVELKTSPLLFDQNSVPNTDRHAIVLVLNNLKKFPELLGSFSQYLLFKKSGTGDKVTRRRFVERHLMAIPQFRALLQLAESELQVLSEILAQFLETAADWLWRKFSTFLKQIRKDFEIHFHIEGCRGNQEKLWPLLMAFKNN